MNRRNIKNCLPFRSGTNRSRRKCGKVDYRQLSSVSSVVLYDALRASRRKKEKLYVVERIINRREVCWVSI